MTTLTHRSKTGPLILFLATLFWAALLEIGLRVLPTPVRDEFLNEKFNVEYKSSNPLSAAHPIFGKWNKPNAQGILERREYKMHVQINSKGLRGPERDYQKSTSRYRILFLGDSFTFGTGVEEEETFVRLSEERLSPDTEAINGAAPGVSTPQQSLFLRVEGVKYSPDLVILCFFQNDIQDNYVYTLERNKPVHLSTAGFFIYRAYGKVSSFLEQSLYGRSALYAGVTYLKRNLLLPYTISPQEFQVTRSYLNEIKEFCDRERIHFGVVYIPRREELRRPDSEKMTFAYLRKYCQQNKIPYLNLWEKFRERQEYSSLYFPLDTHLSPYGHRLTSELIASFINKSWSL